MSLTLNQRARVQAVLDSEDPSITLATIATLETPEELHEVMSEYNWDDGFAVPSAVLEHPACERGTASLIYFDAQGPWTAPSARSGAHLVLLSRAEEQLLSGQLSERKVSYDPKLGAVDLHKLRTAGVAEELLRPSGPTSA